VQLTRRTPGAELKALMVNRIEAGDRSNDCQCHEKDGHEDGDMSEQHLGGAFLRRGMDSGKDADIQIEALGFEVREKFGDVPCRFKVADDFALLVGAVLD